MKEIKNEMNKVQKFLSNQVDPFDINIGNILIDKSAQSLKNIKNKLKIASDIDNYLIGKKHVLEDILRKNFGNNKGKLSANLIKSIENANNLIDKQKIKNRIEKFLKKIQASTSPKTSSVIKDKNSLSNKTDKSFKNSYVFGFNGFNATLSTPCSINRSSKLTICGHGIIISS